MKKIRVAVFDDSKFFLDGIKIMLDGREDMELCGCFENADRARAAVKKCAPDVVLMDIDMPGISGIEALKNLKQHYPQLPVMMLTDHDKEDLIIESISAGADGYTLKIATSKMIIENIKTVYAGNGAFCPMAARLVLKIFAKRIFPVNDKDTYSLSAREKEVLGLLVKGKSYKMIAVKLGITYDTVRAHIKSIYRKMRVASTSGLVSKAVRENIV